MQEIGYGSQRCEKGEELDLVLLYIMTTNIISHNDFLTLKVLLMLCYLFTKTLRNFSPLAGSMLCSFDNMLHNFAVMY